MSFVARLEETEFRPEAALAELNGMAAGDGAVVSFVGLVRPESADGVAIERLFLDHHPRLTLGSIEEIAADALDRFGVSHTYVVHRCGAVLPGQPIVFAGASAPHRRAAFEAADFLMDRLKTDAVFWKREDRADGAFWIEPTLRDVEDRARWAMGGRKTWQE
jgi:molybdopterin synthase catalytic subunit